MQNHLSIAPVVAALCTSFAVHANPEQDTIVVTGTREAQSKQDVAESISLLSQQALENIGASHPAEALNRLAGVHINNLGGEGHMTSIRQPITTSAVYLFLEDGLPIRPTGFFNHNALYEINMPQAGRLEVVKGPGSALYGSDAIGGVINVLTAPAPQQTLLKANVELGENDWQRLLVSYGNKINTQHAGKLDINLTDNQGYRDAADYSRYSVTARLDSNLSDNLSAKTLLTASDIQQSGTSNLTESQYKAGSTFNAYHGDIGYREVSALRFSSDISWYVNEQTLVSAVPYYRSNSMQMMPSWMITYDPNIRDYQFKSYGLMLKYRQHINQGTVIVGLDTDVTPSDYVEEQISLTKQDDIYTDYSRTGQLNYDFSATQTSLSPYIHTEWDLTDNWRLTVGVRYDSFDVDYTDNLAGQVEDTSHLRPQSQTKSYQHTSPKFSLLYRVAADHTAYFNYRNAFVAPSVGSLFRPGSSKGSENLQPTEADSFEIGLRGQLAADWLYELAVYDLQKSNDIVSVINGSDRIVTNAGESRHLGFEAAIQGKLTDEWSLSTSIAITNQYYQDFAYLFQCFSPACGGFKKENRNYAGFKVGKAPAEMANLTLKYQPTWLQGFSSEVEVEHLGEYFTDETNTQTYAGHTLVNWRNHYQINANWQVYLRIINLTDKLYSVYTSNQVGNPNLGYRPGTPRSIYVGATWQL
ncbi:Outer membrane receptor for ferrienterochelin and colicins [Catenovulum agarivorans DS-2]|uniref:Outer membrane receptor for ferrienterochelin and colicins n=1 Tax=Catenovulum agarivorans DS-2 TaxID=1328313 RepID=W7QKZ3_9ALTE|nr:TonB-dependent receptor [Catenovulum agarivorans]EWH08778.1 Outer membrane receptor for ferrienterochelin and colicins [Catenovulum agarivorans DS-2]